MSVNKVFIIHSNPSFRRGVKAVLRGTDDIRVVGEASPGPTVVEKVAAANPDLAIIGSPADRPSLYALLEELKSERPKMCTLILADQPTSYFYTRLKAEGADGCLDIADTSADLPKAIRTIISGNSLWEEEG